MSKTLNVNTGNYTIRTSDGQTITLDTGAQVGNVVVTGNLQVQGTTTTVESADLNVEDNIITLNSGEDGSGVTLDRSGIQIDRGLAVDAQLVFDETVTHNDPASQTNKPGTWTFRDTNGVLLGLRTNSISTGGSDLYLINSGTGVINVSGTNNYENQVTDDDDVPNKKYVDDAITTGIQTITIQKIQRGDSILNVFDQSLDGGVSNFSVTIDSQEKMLVKADVTEIEDISFEGTNITAISSNGELTLKSNATEFVKIDSTLKMPVQDDSAVILSDPTHILVYGKDPDHGNTGIWYKNKNNYEDELISTNKSLLYSMLF